MAVVVLDHDELVLKRPSDELLTIELCDIETIQPKHWPGGTAHTLGLDQCGQPLSLLVMRF